MKKLNCRPKTFLSTLITLFTVSAIVIIIICTSCCIDLGEFSKSESVKITFNGDEIDAAKIYQDIDYTAIKKELSDASNYQVSAEEEEKFFNNLGKIYSEERFALAKDYLENFKNLYPSGYFTLVKVTQRQDYRPGYGMLEIDTAKTRDEVLSKYKIQKDFNTDYSIDIGYILHELTHNGSGRFICLFVEDLKDFSFIKNYSYMIGNLLVFIEKDKMFFSKYELFDDIKNPDFSDKIYLDQSFNIEAYLDPDRPYIIEGEEVKGSDIDFTIILDELNAYTVNAKCVAATEHLISRTGSSWGDRYGLLKQMSHLELYLKRCYEKYPEDWKYITEHKGLAFLIMKLWLEAEKFENAIKDDPRFNLDSKPVSEFVYNPDNYKIIEMFFGQSGILEYKNKNFKDIDVELDNLKVYDINDL